ncbi:MAG: hypothetical protein RBT59_07050, partial [Arcobacteraceae bacterium]|nr:hypothetical protein [Arcobacteraceae bacterium]
MLKIIEKLRLHGISEIKRILLFALIFIALITTTLAGIINTEYTHFLSSGVILICLLVSFGLIFRILKDNVNLLMAGFFLILQMVSTSSMLITDDITNLSDILMLIVEIGILLIVWNLLINYLFFKDYKERIEAVENVLGVQMTKETKEKIMYFF